MYGHNARQELLAILKDDPDLKEALVFNSKDEQVKVGLPVLRKVVDRILVGLWDRGFMVSARSYGSAIPKGATRGKPLKLKPQPQMDIEEEARWKAEEAR